jgi:2-amino-4-hydroxy-6-hydroxymethyldihydropteridine diphosphokinase
MSERAMSERHHWFPAYVGLGSNLDGPVQQLEKTFDELNAIPDTRLIKKSSLYRSAPFGGVEQPDFVNAVASLLTQLSALELLQHLQSIEDRRGRERGEVRWGPRILDLDLLVYSDQRINEDDLIVPHPGIIERNFVLLPLAEIAPKLTIPGLGQISSIDASCFETKISRIDEGHQ